MSAVPGGDPEKTLVGFDDWPDPITFFVGRNGSGKSRAARAVANEISARYLSTDRLAGLMTYESYGWTAIPQQDANRGVPLAGGERGTATNLAQRGSGVEEMYTLREQPEVWLRVAAFLRRALGRHVELRESAGFLDPYIRVGNLEYSLIRDEGHGLRELVILLTAVYRDDWSVLIVDEPELHLHPSMARLWLAELRQQCATPDRRAIVVTHEPSLIRPASAADLSGIRYFAFGHESTPLIAHVHPKSSERVTASLRRNPLLVSQLVFSPRPVLVEGRSDVAALSTCLNRLCPPEVVTQTDLVDCGSSGGVALWYEITRSAGIDAVAIADLDAVLASEVQRAMDNSDEVVSRYTTEVLAVPPLTREALRQLFPAMDAAGVEANPKPRAVWLANAIAGGTDWAPRIRKVLEIWKDAGLWLHPQGTLEDVLGIPAKGFDAAERAAEGPTALDDAANWCAYKLDPSAEVRELLAAEVERIAHSIMEATRMNPDLELHAPVGNTAESDARLVTVAPDGDGFHRITVVKPDEFKGYWVRFSRDTPSSQLSLTAP